MANCRVKCNEIWDGGVISLFGVPLTFKSLQSLGVLVSKWARKQLTIKSQTQSEICTLEFLYNILYDLLVFNVILGSFSALLSKWNATQNWVGHRLQWNEIESHGLIVVICIWGAFDLIAFKVINGVIWCICLKMSCN